MDKINSQEEFIEKIREIDERLKKIRISSVEIDKKTNAVKYLFICPETIDETLKNKILEVAERCTPSSFQSVEIGVFKIVVDDSLVNNEIYKFLTKEYPSISIFLKTTDIRSTVYGDSVRYVVRLTKDGAEYFKRGGVDQKLNSYLGKKFCSDFMGDAEVKEQEISASLLNDEIYESEVQKIEHRTIKVINPVTIDDENIGDLALYIEDAKEGEVTVCGIISKITERQGERITDSGEKKTYTYFLIYLDDTTGRISGIYFPRKSVYDKIKTLTEGDAVICRGSISERERGKSFKIDKLNKCTFPQDFEKKEKYKKHAPERYSTIFPKKAETVKIESVFDDNSIPKELMENTYVVFDFETTGLDVNNCEITDIGAVKIEKGVITEEFSSLIKVNVPLSQKITELTGITDQMLKDKPRIDVVLPDFMKFIDGTILVGHNAADFDMRFLKKFAYAEDYEVKNKIIDTMDMTRKYLPTLRRADLHTVADYFNISFNHHRALADAYATAEVFINLTKIKESKGE